MLSLVTQRDGSTRRLPLISYALVLLIGGFYLHWHFGPAKQDSADVTRQIETVVVPYFEEHPYLDVDPQFAAIMGAERTRMLHEQYIADREAIGLAMAPALLRQQAQLTFDVLVAEVFQRIDGLPTWRHGVFNEKSSPQNMLTHVVVHDSVLPLVLSLFLMLCVGIALEDVWGSILFAGFCALCTATAAGTYAVVYGHLGLPWYGASGLVAGLLGAYLVRAIRWPAHLFGALPLPGWLLLMTWVAMEYLVVRGLRPDTIGAAPWIAHAASFGIGILSSLALWKLGAEDSLRSKEEKKRKKASSPVLEKALAAHEAGRSSEAFELLQPEFQNSGRNRDVAIGLWTIALALERPQDAVAPLLTVIQDSLRRRDHAEAAQYWLDLSQAVGRIEAAPAFLVRVGEALLEQEHPAEALTAFHQAVDAPEPPTAVLLRVIRVASDSDSDLTQRAAALALADPQLDAVQREKLVPLAGDLNPSQASPVAIHEAPPSEQVESSSLPQQEEQDGPTQADGSSLDPNAISMDSLSDDTKGDDTKGDDTKGDDTKGDDTTGDDAVGEVASDSDEQERWNDPSLVEDLSWELPDEENQEASNSVDQGGVDPEQLADDAHAPTGELRTLKLRTGVPLMLDERGLKLESDEGGKSRVTYDRLEALGVAVVAGMDGGEPVHLIDVVLNWTAMSDEPLKVIRMRSDHFDATQLYPDAESRLEALRCLINELLERSEANPLPSADAARGQPFASYDSLEDYERSVLMVSGKAPSDA